MSKSSSLPPLTPPPRGRSTPPDASDPDSTPRGDEKGRRLRERLPASVSAPLLKADESPSRRSSSESVGVIAGGGAGASAALGASAELERARLLHALGVDLLAASLPEAAHGFMQRALRSAPPWPCRILPARCLCSTALPARRSKVHSLLSASSKPT